MRVNIHPGQIVEIDGTPHLVESVQLNVVAQRIVPLKPMLDRNEANNYENPESHCPVFIRLTGDINDPQFRSPKLKVLSLEGESE